MFRRSAALALWAVAALALCAATGSGQSVSGPKVDSTLPGPILALNINGPFADRYHCLICEFRLAPVAMVLVRAQSEKIDPEVQKLLEALDKLADERHDETGLETFAVFLTPQARSGATEDKSVDPTAIIPEAVNREKLVNNLKEQAKSFKRMILATCPIEEVASRYKLAQKEKAEVTVILYASHNVMATYAFGDGQLRQEGTDSVAKGVVDLLGRLKKSPALVK